MNRLLKKFALCLLPVALLCGCRPKQGTEPSREAAAPAGGKFFVMVAKVVDVYYEPCYEGFQQAAKKYGVKTEFRAPKATEVPQQVEIMENLIARHVDGIALSALDDEGLKAAIGEATAAGIKVITFDAPAPSSEALTYIGTANEAAGYAAAEQLAGIIHSQGEVAVLQGGLGSPNLNDRFKGFQRFMAEKAPKVKIVAHEDDQSRTDVTVNKTEALLEAHPNLTAIFGLSAEVCPGAAAALEQQGKAGRVVLAGFDDLPNTVAAIRKGVVSFCIAQRTFKMGWLSIGNLLDAVNNKPLPRQIDTGIVIINKDNVDTYMQDMKKEFEK
jgi:ribose transport system substrate-binding protein